MVCGDPPLKCNGLGFVKAYGTNHMVNLCYNNTKFKGLWYNGFCLAYYVYVYGMYYTKVYDVKGS